MLNIETFLGSLVIIKMEQEKNLFYFNVQKSAGQLNKAITFSNLK